MFGFIFGVAVTLFVLKHVRGGGWRRGNYSQRQRRRAWVLDRLGSRLDTTPSQDRALGDVVDDLFEAFAEERGTFGRVRSALAEALRRGEYDESVLNGLRADQDASLDRVQAAVDEALKTAHEVLDDEQRERLASLVRNGPHAHNCGPRGHRRRRHMHAA